MESLHRWFSSSLHSPSERSRSSAATLTAGIENDASKQAFATGLISFADKIGATIVAEGIEREEEVGALRALGVHYGQGFYLGRPDSELPTSE
jgi:EAL domain-containing protein (putative c-di-GMP-specific phosphodiesterase class I)